MILVDATLLAAPPPCNLGWLAASKEVVLKGVTLLFQKTPSFPPFSPVLNRKQNFEKEPLGDGPSWALSLSNTETGEPGKRRLPFRSAEIKQ